MKPEIKIGFVDYFSPIDQFFTEALSYDFKIARDDNEPSYLFFCDSNFGNTNLKFDDTRIRKIFYTGENARPWNYKCHHAISFEHLDGPQFFRLPLYVIDDWWYQKSLNLPSIKNIHRHNYSTDKEGFCSFVVRNGNCQPRNDIFNLISEYKRVDSAGEWLNNTGYILDRSPGQFHLSKLKFLKTRKFNLCYENGSYPGYVTEKVYHSLYAGSIPIYWGSPTVATDFNPSTLISRHDFESDGGMLEWIKQVDNDDRLYNSIVNEPIFRYNAHQNIDYFDLTRFNRWFWNNVWKG